MEIGKIEVLIPDQADILSRGIDVSLADRGVPWGQNQLGQNAGRRGVYIIHQSGAVLYVGKTGGKKMTFGIRLRREFQRSAAQDRHIYPKLAKLPRSQPIKVSLLPQDDTWVRSLVKTDGVILSDYELSDYERTSILEQALIASYKPRFQEAAP